METDESEWEPELLESHLVGHDPEGPEFKIELAAPQTKRGPKKLPVMWSRVISISEDADEDIGTWNIEFELAELLRMPRPLPPRREPEWMPIFRPTSYAKAHPEMTLEGFALGEKRLRTLGIEVSKIREALRKEALHQAKAEGAEQQRDLHEISRLARRISRGEFREGAQEKQMIKPDFQETVAIRSRHRSKRRGPLTISERIDIAHRVLVGYEMHADLAREYRVSSGVIAQLIFKAKRHKGFLKELLMKRDEKQRRKEQIAGFVEGLNAERVVIDNAAQIVTDVGAQLGIETTEWEARSVMREELGMRFRKIKTVALHSNSERNLVLRQRWALEFLAQARKKKIFLNVDETWLGMSDFRRMKWQAPGTTNSIAKLEVAPRVTMIVGLDSRGRVYLALA